MIVHAGCAAFSDVGYRCFRNNFNRVGGGAGHWAGASDVAHGAETHGAGGDCFACFGLGHLGDWHQQAVALDNFAFMGVVNVGQLQLFTLNVLPHIQFGPVGNWEYAHVLTGVNAGVVQVPKFWALAFRIPLAKAVAERKNTFFGACLFFIAACATHQRIEAKFFLGFQQGDTLKCIARSFRVGQANGAFFDRAFQ